MWMASCLQNVPVRELSRRVGTVFQNPEAQLFMLRVGEDVAFGCENLGLPPVETQSRVERAPHTGFPSASLRNQEVFSSLGRPETAIGHRRGLGDGLPDALVGRADQRPRRLRAVRICLRPCAICTRQGTRS